MKKNRIITAGAIVLACIWFGGCASNGTKQDSKTADQSAVVENAVNTETLGTTESMEADTTEQDTEDTAVLADGVYTAEFQTDSSMFHVSEACEGKGTLTVENGEMTEDAAKEGADLLVPTEDTVTYSDGLTEEVYGFDVPVPAIDQEFDLALIGTKGKWYDHKVTVSDPQPVSDEQTQAGAADGLEDGSYTVELTFEGGSGKAQILSPATINVADGNVTATVQWSSENYDYMIVGGEKYLPLSTEGGSVFEIPVLAFDEPMDVIGDTVAMSKPHEIEYKITFLSDTIKAVE